MARHGGLQDAVGDGWHQKRARPGLSALLLDYDLEEGVRPVLLARHPLEQLRNLRPRPPRELLDRDSVGARAPGVLLHALPRFPKLLGGKRKSHQPISAISETMGSKFS